MLTARPLPVAPRRWPPLLGGFLAVLVVALSFLVALVSPPAGAATLLGADTTQNVVLAVPWASLLVSQAIPLLVALVTAAHAPSSVKALANLLLSALAAALTVLVDNGGSVPLVEFASAFFVVLVGAQTGHRVLWSHVGEPGIRKALPGGVGAPNT